MRCSNPGFVPDSPIGLPMTPELEEFFRKLPKAELHCHLLGTVTSELFAELAEASGAGIPPETVKEFYTRGEKPVGVLRIFRTLEEKILLKPEMLTRITKEHLARAAGCGVRYTELYLNWTGLAHSFDYAAVQEAVLNGIRFAQAYLGIEARLIPAVDREDTPEKAVELVRQMLLHPSDLVPGIGMDYRETGHPPEKFWKAYRIAREGGLRTTAHAGEFGEHWRNVETAVCLLGCRRVDHGYTAVENPSLEAFLRERNVIFAVVPTNSYYLRTLPEKEWAVFHPIPRMVADGLRVFPNTDDPAMHGVNPGEAWSLMRSAFGFRTGDIRKFLVNAIDAAWVADDVKSRWSAEWLREFDELAAALPAGDRN